MNGIPAKTAVDLQAEGNTLTLQAAEKDKLVDDVTHRD